jgi:hypothetical protein
MQISPKQLKISNLRRVGGMAAGALTTRRAGVD